MSLNSGFGTVKRSLNVIKNANPEVKVFEVKEEIVRLQLKGNDSMQTTALYRNYSTAKY